MIRQWKNFCRKSFAPPGGFPRPPSLHRRRGTTFRNDMNSENLSIKLTNDFSEFKLVKGNRIIDPKHVNELKKSIKAVGYIGAPVLVNKSKEIIDGQHRVEACRQLNVSVPYQIVDSADIDYVITLNATQKNWHLHDYINSYAARGFESYQIIRRFLKESGFVFDISTFLLLGSEGKNKANAIKNGTVMCTEEMYQKAIKVAQYLHQFDGIKTNRRQAFIRGIVYSLRIPDVEQGLLTKRINANPRAFEYLSDMFDCVKVIEKVYNKGRRKDYVYIETELRKMFMETKIGKVFIQKQDRKAASLFQEEGKNGI